MQRLAYLHHHQLLPACNARCTFDCLIRAFHSLYCNASAIAHDHHLPQVESCNLPGDFMSVGDISGFRLIRSALRQNPRLRQKRPQKFCRIYEFDAFFAQHAGNGAYQRVRILCRQRK